MPPLFRRNSNLACFFCQSPVVFPRDPRNFRCPSCGCWNRYDVNGEIISDEPAMHDEQLNSKSFSKRASPSKQQLPSIYGPGPFCHDCQTNQMLLVHLLSNYLPSPEDPEYAQRLEMLPAYKESLHLRYPPVCDDCAPLVEDEIRRKEQMARVQALGGWLSKGKARHRKVSGPTVEVEREGTVSETVFWWKLRGFLWVASFVLSTVANAAAMYDYYPFKRWAYLCPIFPLLVLLSLLWTAWDPTYSSFRKAQIQGRDVRLHGKRAYNTFQILTWACRLVSSILLSIHWFSPRLVSFQLHPSLPHYSEWQRSYTWVALSLEGLTILVSCFIPRIHHPPAIRLIDTHSHRLGSSSRGSTPNPPSRGSTPAASFRATPSLTENDVLAALSFSSRPVITTPSNPIFGVTSLQAAASSSTASHQPHVRPPSPPTPPDERGEYEMDWTPTASSSGSAFAGNNNHNVNNNGNDNNNSNSNSWLRPQRFFAPEKPTGLENLLANARLQDDSPTPRGRHNKDHTYLLRIRIRSSTVFYLLFSTSVAVVLLGVVLYWDWFSWFRPTPRNPLDSSLIMTDGGL